MRAGVRAEVGTEQLDQPRGLEDGLHQGLRLTGVVADELLHVTDAMFVQIHLTIILVLFWAATDRGGHG